jgi:hypothetical protein
LESRQPLGIGSEDIGQQLQCNVTLKLRIPRAIHFSHSTAPKQGKHLIAADSLSDCDGHESYE